MEYTMCTSPINRYVLVLRVSFYSNKISPISDRAFLRIIVINREEQVQISLWQIADVVEKKRYIQDRWNAQ